MNLAIIYRHKIRANALSVFALLLGTASVSSCASVGRSATAPEPALHSANWRPPELLDPHADHSVFIGKIVSVESLGFLDCGEGNICLNLDYKLTIEPIDVISGNPDIAAQTCVVNRHTAPAQGIPGTYATKRKGEGKWQVDCSSLGRQVDRIGPTAGVFDE